MFVKAQEKKTLAKIFIEAMKVEKDIASISSSQGNEENKTFSSEKNIKKKGILRMDTEKKNKETTDIASMQRVIKQLTHELIDLKKGKGEGKKHFKPFMKKRTDSAPQILPHRALISKIMQWIIYVALIMRIILRENVPN